MLLDRLKSLNGGGGGNETSNHNKPFRMIQIFNYPQRYPSHVFLQKVLITVYKNCCVWQYAHENYVMIFLSCSGGFRVRSPDRIPVGFRFAFAFLHCDVFFVCSFRAFFRAPFVCR